eukprot:772860_1
MAAIKSNQKIKLKLIEFELHEAKATTPRQDNITNGITSQYAKEQLYQSATHLFIQVIVISTDCFAGCILTHNLITNIALALVYLSFTAFACLQFIWYEYLLKRRNFAKQQSKHPLAHSPSSSSYVRSRHSLPLSINDWWGGSPNFARRYNPPAPCPMSPTLRKTLKIVARSPRMFAISSQLTDEMRQEYLTLQAKQRQRQNHLFSDDEYEEETYTSSNVMPHNLNQCMDITPKPNATISSITRSVHSNSASINAAVDTQPLATNNNNPNYGAMSTIMSTLSSMTTTVVMMYGLQSVQYTADNDAHNTGRVLLDTSHNVNHSGDSLIMIGMMLGWASSIIYISSRIPQLKLMMNTKAVSGINPLFFVLTFSGNLTQCLSMLVSKEIYTNQKDLFSKLPWLASSGVCIFQDGLIIFLIWLYHVEVKRTSKLKHKYVSRSKGVMMPSPHYLVPMDPDHTKEKRKKHKKKKKWLNKKGYDTAYFDYKYGDEDLQMDNGRKKEQNKMLILNTV